MEPIEKVIMIGTVAKITGGQVNWQDIGEITKQTNIQKREGTMALKWHGFAGHSFDRDGGNLKENHWDRNNLK